MCHIRVMKKKGGGYGPGCAGEPKGAKRSGGSFFFFLMRQSIKKVESKFISIGKHEKKLL